MALRTAAVALAGLASLCNGLSTTMELDYGTFKGKNDLLTSSTSFLGMPFAKAGRLENPRLIGPQDKLSGVQDATDYGPACPQQELTASPLEQGNAEVGEIIGAIQAIALPNITRQQEDCLSINVQVPKGVKSTDKLPVLMWIHGGGFELGSSGSLGSEATAIQGVIYQVRLQLSHDGALSTDDDLHRVPTSSSVASTWANLLSSFPQTTASTSLVLSLARRSPMPESPTSF